MVRVDVQPDAIFVRIDAMGGSATTEGFREHDRRAAVQNAHRLHRAVIDRHSCRNPIIANVEEFDAKAIDRRVQMNMLDLIDVGAPGPNGHGVIRSFCDQGYSVACSFVCTQARAAACNACGSKPAKRL